MLFPLPQIEVVDSTNYEAALATAATSAEMMQSLLLDRKPHG